MLQLARRQGTSEGDASPPGPTEPSAPETPEEGVRHGAFIITREGMSWTCCRCDAVTPFDARICGVCGASFAEVLKEPPPERPERDPGMAALVSLFFPGAGHGYLGLWGQAIARAILSGWVVLVTLFAATQKVSGSSIIAICYGLAAFALWGIASHDAYREARREPHAVILKNKYFLHVVLGLLGMLMLIVFAAAISAR